MRIFIHNLARHRSAVWCGLMLLAFLLGRPDTASALPALGLDTVVVAPGSNVMLSLSMTTSSATCAGFNATVYLPKGVVYQGAARGPLIAASGFRFHAAQLPDTSVNALALVGYSETLNFSTTGVLCTLSLQVGPALGPGNYPVILNAPDRSATAHTSHALSSSDGASSPAHGQWDGLLIVRYPSSLGDVNGNGIPDAWEQSNFGVVTNVNDTTDFDGDGLSDYREYLSGTDPTDPGSCLAIIAAKWEPSANRGLVISWFSITGTLYRVERAQNLQDIYPFEPIGVEQWANPPMNVYTDETAVGSAPFYYQIRMITP